MQTNRNEKKILSFRFLVEIDGITVGGFSEVSGFEETIETEDYKEGGGYFVHKLPKGIVQSTLKLKRGMSLDDELWRWFSSCKNAILNGKPLKKKQINIRVFEGNVKEEQEQNERKQIYFTFNHAYPVKWSGTTLNATNNSVAIEELEIVHEGMIRNI